MGDYSQLVANILISAAGIFIFAVALLLAYRVGGMLNFAYGALLTCGAYSALVLKNYCAFPVFAAAAVGVIVTVGLGCTMENYVFRVLRRKGASSLVLLLASLGLYISLVSIIAMVFGEGSKTLRSEMVSEGIAVLGTRITLPQMLAMATSVILVICLPLFLRYTRIGRAALALASDFDLARIAGIHTERVRLYITAIAAGLAGVAGVFAGFDRNIIPTMGMSALMAGIVTVVIGGGRSIAGVALAAMALGVLQNLGAWAMSAQWENTVTFGVLLAFLLVRPEGVMGKRLTKATV